MEFGIDRENDGVQHVVADEPPPRSANRQLQNSVTEPLRSHYAQSLPCVESAWTFWFLPGNFKNSLSEMRCIARTKPMERLRAIRAQRRKTMIWPRTRRDAYAAQDLLEFQDGALLAKTTQWE
jgi:hypothetical protein